MNTPRPIGATTDRRVILAELAATRAENTALRKNRATRTISEAEQQAARNAARERRRKARATARAKSRAEVHTSALLIEFRLTPADPNAELHRRILLNALKEHQ